MSLEKIDLEAKDNSVDPAEGDPCPHCKEDVLIFIRPNEPWCNEHLYCPYCDSTYAL
jgi:hypothetical protein